MAALKSLSTFEVRQEAERIIGGIEPGPEVWKMANERGWTVAHEVALLDILPEDFPGWDWEADNGVTVAEAYIFLPSQHKELARLIEEARGE
jgi:hypothetical protein